MADEDVEETHIDPLELGQGRDYLLGHEVEATRSRGEPNFTLHPHARRRYPHAATRRFPLVSRAACAETAGWRARLKEIIPSYGQSLIEDPALALRLRAETAEVLHLDNVVEAAR